MASTYPSLPAAIPIPASSSFKRSTTNGSSDSGISVTPPAYLTRAEWPSTSSSQEPISISPSSSRAHTTDSGYATGTNTSFTSPVGSSSSLNDGKNKKPVSLCSPAHSNTKSVPLPGHDHLRIFRVDVDPTHVWRFREVIPEMQRLLQKGILASHKHNSPFGLLGRGKSKTGQGVAVSLRLMTVGKGPETARPAVVVFVGAEQAATVEKILAGPELRMLYRPGDGVPEFDVVVVAQAPKKRLGRGRARRRGGDEEKDLDIFWAMGRTDVRDAVTFCGAQIVLETTEGLSAAATFGGVVKVTYGSGNFELVGMTAGHVLSGLLDLETGMEEEGSVENDDKLLTLTHPRVMGTLLYPSPRLVDSISGHDWALLSFDDRLKIRPNLLQQAEGRQAVGGWVRKKDGCGNAFTVAEAGCFPALHPIEAAMLGSSGRIMLGLLSHLPGGIMLNPDQGFVDAYLLVLDEGLALQDGDSGSWVVNPISNAVYGHVVADDLTGDAYVVPLHNSLDEMREQLGVESVDLPTMADFLDIALRATPECGKRSEMLEPRCIIPMTARTCSRDRRLSEVLSLCEGLRLRQGADSVDDGDSGYGSLGSCSNTPKAGFLCGIVDTVDETVGGEGEHSFW